MATDSFGSAPAGGAVMPCPLTQQKHWLEIELVDEEGKPVPNAEYKVVLPDGQVIRGFLNERGTERIAPIEQPGSCKVSFPAFDRKDWKTSG